MFWVLLAEETSYYAFLGCILTRESRLIKLWIYEPKKAGKDAAAKSPSWPCQTRSLYERTMANINSLSSKEVQITPRGSKDARERFRWIRCIVKLAATSLFWVLLSSAKKNLPSKCWAQWTRRDKLSSFHHWRLGLRICVAIAAWCLGKAIAWRTEQQLATWTIHRVPVCQLSKLSGDRFGVERKRKNQVSWQLECQIRVSLWGELCTHLWQTVKQDIVPLNSWSRPTPNHTP